MAIHKKILDDHPIPEVIQGYGHEDTLFSSLLEKAEIPIKHIDNPVVHLGLENNQRFLEKGAQAIQNLVLLAEKGYPQHQHRLYQTWRSFFHPLLKWVPTTLLLWKLKCTQWILLGPLADPKWYDLFKMIQLELANRKHQKRN